MSEPVCKWPHCEVTIRVLGPLRFTCSRPTMKTVTEV